MSTLGRGMPWVLTALVLLAACTRDEDVRSDAALERFPLQVPTHWPSPPEPADNPLTTASVRLGKALFFDERLSLGRGSSCAGCHHPARAFSDTVALSIGVHGGTGLRNAPSLANVAYHPLLLRDGGAPTLEQQVMIPLMDPLEMDSDPQQVVEALQGDRTLQALSMQAYGRPLDLFVLVRAIANYERTLIGGSSRYDRFLQGDTQALTMAEVRGMQLFNGPANCATCHSGFNFSDQAFHNIGTSLDHSNDPGRQRISLSPADRGKFKTPTLRNIALTAPYMHDGSMATLEGTIAHFESGGLPDPNKDPAMVPLQLSAQDRKDLLAFLHALTDERPLDHVE